MERINGHQRGAQVGICFCLHRIVGVPVVVDGSQSGMDFSSGHETETTGYVPIIMPADRIIEFSAHLIGISGSVGCITEESVEDALHRNPSLQPVCLPQCLVQEAQVRSGISDG